MNNKTKRIYTIVSDTYSYTQEWISYKTSLGPIDKRPSLRNNSLSVLRPTQLNLVCFGFKINLLNFAIKPLHLNLQLIPFSLKRFNLFPPTDATNLEPKIKY